MIKPRAWIIVILISLSFFTACSSTSKKSKEEIRTETLSSVALSLQENDPDLAISTLQDLNEKSPEVDYFYAYAHQAKGNRALAIQYARSAIELNPKFSPAKNLLGKLLMDEGQTQEAQKWLKQAAADRNYPEAFLAKTNLGILYQQSKRIDLSKEWFSLAIKEQPQFACVAYLNRGKQAYSDQNYPSAKADFVHAAGGKCYLAEAHLMLARTQFKLGKPDLARKKYLDVTKLFPESTEAQFAIEEMREIP